METKQPVNRKPQVVSFIAKTSAGQKSEFPGVQDVYLRKLMHHLETEIDRGISSTSGANMQREVSLLFRLDSPDVRKVVTITEKSVLQPSQVQSVSDGSENDDPADAKDTFRTVQGWVVKVMQRVVSERASSIELILVFKRRQLVGRRETLNAQVL